MTRQYQAEKLGAIGIDPSGYGGLCDPAFFIGLSIQAGAESGISAEGNVNMLTELVQHRPIPLDEDLALTGTNTVGPTGAQGASNSNNG